MGAVVTGGTYPSCDIVRSVGADGEKDDVRSTISAPLAGVEEGSAAWAAGFEAGCALTALDGVPIADILDWRWRSCEDRIEVGYIDREGEAGSVVLEREEGEDWGFVFDGSIFDGVRRCRNACTFCFMRQLPLGLRPSLYVRDDDFRLSFLAGTFVTLTNVTDDDVVRMVEQRLSPLHVSLHAVDPTTRRLLMGKNALRGLQVLDRLLQAGIQCHCQVVLVPQVNDGAQLAATLEWAWERPGILSVGIVPLGFTRHQDVFDHSFNDPAAAQAVLDAIAPFQRRGCAQRGTPWVFAADEFYCNAFGDQVLGHLPSAAHYGDFSLFEDGIGIVRTVVDQWRSPEVAAAAVDCAGALRAADRRAFMVSGWAQRPFFDALVRHAGIDDVFSALYVSNRFFGGNVDVTGLLCGTDIADAVRRLVRSDPRAMVFVPSIIFNDDGVALDGQSVEAMEAVCGHPLCVVSLSAQDYLQEIAEFVRSSE